jgi:hypothetical protein
MQCKINVNEANLLAFFRAKTNHICQTIVGASLLNIENNPPGEK